MAVRTKLIFAALALVIAAVAGRLLLGDGFDAPKVIAWLREAGTSSGALPLFLALFGLVTTLFGPALVMMVAAGVTWGFFPGWVFVWLGANVWANIHFAVGRWIAGDSIRAWLEKRKAQWLTRELDQGGVFATIMVRQLPLPYVLVNLAGGASPMPWWRWAVGNAVGLLPNCIIYTQLAAALADGVDGAKHDAVVRVLITATLVIGMSLLTRWIQRRYAAKSQPG
ncbi:MAG: VTT domain-containing protein [Archangium sp.]|nr:VTT domain-containing protein [Archangium sp.]